MLNACRDGICPVCERTYGGISEYEHLQSKQHKVSNLCTDDNADQSALTDNSTVNQTALTDNSTINQTALTDSSVCK